MKHLLLTTIAAVVLMGCGPNIHEAAKTGNIKAVKQHLDAGADVNAKDDKFGLTPLHFAAGRGNKEVVELLIAKGVDVNAKNNRGGTPLHLPNNKEIAELLIANGADVNAKDEDGETPLDWAIRNSNWKHVRRKRAETADLIHKHGGKTRKQLEAAELGVSVEGLPYISIHDAAGAAGRDGNNRSRQTALDRWYGCGCERCGRQDSFATCGLLGSQRNRRTAYRQRCRCECEG